MAVATYAPYNYGRMPSDELDENRRAMNAPDGSGADAGAPSTTGPAPYMPNSPSQGGTARPQPADQTGRMPAMPAAAQPMTFSQMQDAGLPRPPAPAPAPANRATFDTSANINVQPTTPATVAPGQNTAPVNAVATTPTASAAPTNTALDQWWATYGGGGPRYSVVNGSTIDHAAMGYGQWAQTAAQSNPALLASIDPAVGQQATQGIADANARFQASLTNGGYEPGAQPYGNGAAGTPGAVPLPQTMFSPPGSAGGSPPSPGVSVPATNGSNPAMPSTGTDTGTPIVGGGTMVNATASSTQPGTNTGNNTDILSLLLNGANGSGAGSAVQNATQQKTLDLLNTPSPYGQQQVQDAYNWLGGQIDDQYNVQRQQLGEEMARRGLGASTIYGGRLNDLNIGQRTAKESLAENLGQNLAQTLGNYETSAINAGNTVGNAATNNQLSWLGSLMGYGQNAFNNDLATQAVNQSQQNSYQNFILSLLGLGYGGSA